MLIEDIKSKYYLIADIWKEKSHFMYTKNEA
jgi:hypothetical protein